MKVDDELRKLWWKLVPANERRERRLWCRAAIRVYRGAKRRRDRGLQEFAWLFAYGCELVQVS